MHLIIQKVSQKTKKCLTKLKVKTTFDTSQLYEKDEKSENRANHKNEVTFDIS